VWTYNQRTGKCTDFVYGDRCGGNDNRFYTKEDCEKTCVFSDVDLKGNPQDPST